VSTATFLWQFGPVLSGVPWTPATDASAMRLQSVHLPGVAPPPVVSLPLFVLLIVVAQQCIISPRNPLHHSRRLLDQTHTMVTKAPQGSAVVYYSSVRLPGVSANDLGLAYETAPLSPTPSIAQNSILPSHSPLSHAAASESEAPYRLAVCQATGSSSWLSRSPRRSFVTIRTRTNLGV
jgi:hypothetical protein